MLQQESCEGSRVVKHRRQQRRAFALLIGIGIRAFFDQHARERDRNIFGDTPAQHFQRTIVHWADRARIGAAGEKHLNQFEQYLLLIPEIFAGRNQFSISRDQ